LGALEDGPLLRAAQKNFDVLVTIDGSLEFQQNLAKLKVAVIVVHVLKNQLVHYEQLKDALLGALETAKPGQVTHVGG
jgi:hypothetical protein